jgi:hypothetical protein
MTSGEPQASRRWRDQPTSNQHRCREIVRRKAKDTDHDAGDCHVPGHEEYHHNIQYTDIETCDKRSEEQFEKIVMGVDAGPN